MDIGSFNVQRPLDNLVYPLNHRCLAGEIFQMLNEFIVRRVKAAKGIELVFYVVLSVSL